MRLGGGIILPACLSRASSREISLDGTVLPSSSIDLDDSTQPGLIATITVDDSFGLARERLVSTIHTVAIRWWMRLPGA